MAVPSRRFWSSWAARRGRWVLACFFLTAALHLSFSFGAKKEKVLPQPYWIEAQNRDGFEVWHYSCPAADHNFVFAPVQDTRMRALTENSMAFKIPALPKEEEVSALNEIKNVLLENRAHQVKIRYEELMLQNSASLEPGTEVKKTAEEYQVGIKKSRFNEPENLKKIKSKLLRSFDVSRDLAAESFGEKQASAGISGFFLKGAWRDRFDAGHTREVEFHSEDGALSVPMMVKAGYHGYFEDDLFQALDLRYGDGKLSFMIFLPHRDSNLRAFYESLNFENWNLWMNSFIERQGAVRIPRFRIETLSEECCRLTVFEVVEKGGKASFRYDMTEVLGTEDHFEFDANRPFFFAVRDNETDLILLMGQFTGVTAPSAPFKKLPA